MSATRRSCSTARAEEAAAQRVAQIADAYAARRAAYAKSPAKSDYKPLPPARLYLAGDEWKERLEAAPLARLTPFDAPPGADDDRRLRRPRRPQLRPRAADRGRQRVRRGGRAYQGPAQARAQRDRRGLERRLARAAEPRARRARPEVAGARLVLAAGEDGAAGRAAARGDRARTGFRGARTSPSSASRTFSATGWSATSSASGARRTCWPRPRALTAGDLVVHIDHGVGRFVGLKTIEAAGAPHDCLEIHYAGGDRLFLPVENLELLSRYGSETGELDKLGGAGWQSRKARLKKRVREMAGELIRVAAQRMTRPAPRLAVPDGLYDEFCARFPYDETQDQESAIEATLDDLAAGRPMDRLVCGDVGFGKTEVALRAAFAAAINCEADRDRRADDAARPPARAESSASASPACRSRSASSRAWSARPSSAR